MMDVLLKQLTNSDIDFAARFYRVLAISLADKQQAVVSRCCNARFYSTGQPL